MVVGYSTHGCWASLSELKEIEVEEDGDGGVLYIRKREVRERRCEPCGTNRCDMKLHNSLSSLLNVGENPLFR